MHEDGTTRSLGVQHLPQTPSRLHTRQGPTRERHSGTTRHLGDGLPCTGTDTSSPKAGPCLWPSGPHHSTQPWVPATGLASSPLHGNSTSHGYLGSHSYKIQNFSGFPLPQVSPSRVTAWGSYILKIALPCLMALSSRISSFCDHSFVKSSSSSYP